GYKVNKQGQFEIDEEEAKIVKDIFKLRTKGLSLAKIGDKYGYSKQKVDYILKNKNYIGVFRYQGKKEKNNITMEIEHIVSRYMWNKVNGNKYNRYIHRSIAYTIKKRLTKYYLIAAFLFEM